MPLAPGTLLHNRYRIVSILGQGGMGAVYRATDEHLQIPVAVKENLFLTEEYGRQFQREAHILAGLRHPNLPHVTDYFSQENQVQYLVMDYIDGEDLRQRMERLGVLPERETLLIGISICDALTYLHTRQPPIVHRDIKPGNIKVTPEGQAVLVDFGLAKIMQGSQVTSTGARAMTPGYSPPEQYGTARTDPRSDIYSLGATLYASLTGVIPEDSLARMTGKADLTPIRELAPKISRKLADTVERALEIDPEDRYQTADEFKQSLIESGELTPYYPERPTISPPPSEEAAVVSVSGGDSKPLLQPVRERSSRRRRLFRKKQTVWLTGASVIGVAILGFLAVLAVPLIRGLQPSFAGSYSTPTAQVTEIASVHTASPGDSTAESAQALLSGEQTPTPSSTPTEEPLPSPTPTITETPAPVATPRGGGLGQLAFASNRLFDNEMQIYVMDASGNNPPVQITNIDGGACQPSWSPDGTQLAFTSPCSGKQDSYPGSNIWIINADGTGATQLTYSIEGDFDPAWSPKGDKIAFTSLQKEQSGIYVINLATKEITRLSKSRYPDKQPAWSPNGAQIAFVRKIGTSQIWYMRSDGLQETRFSVSGPLNNHWPAWSPDGQLIYYSQTTPDSAWPLLVYMSLEDRQTPGAETFIPARAQGDSGPYSQVVPSPDGLLLAYESWSEGNHDIFIMDRNGSNQQRLTTDPGIDFGPAWRPSGSPAN